MSHQSDLLKALHPVLAELHRLNVRHYVGGSVASSFHGASRSTVDVDLVAELNVETATALVTALQTSYYVNLNTAVEAVRRHSCFNLIHLETAFKVDVFVSKGRPFDQRAFSRIVADRLLATDSLVTNIASAEDTIVTKLEWYRLGGETSERQWNDVKLVTRLKGDQLDRDYLRQAAEELGVVDLLVRLFAEVHDAS